MGHGLLSSSILVFRYKYSQLLSIYVSKNHPLQIVNQDMKHIPKGGYVTLNLKVLMRLL